MRWKPRRSDVAVISLSVAVSIALCLGPALWSPCALAAKGRQAAQNPTQPGRDAQRAQAVDAAAGRAGRLIDAGKHEQAARLLVQVRKGLGEERDPRLEGLLARAALALKQPKVALQLAGPFAEKRDAYDPNLTDCYLAAGDAYLATDQPYKALLIFDWMAGQTEGLDLILAAEGCGRALLARKEFQKAVESFRFALRYAQRGYNYPEEIQDIIRRLKAQLAKARRLADIARYGEEFVRYRDAERLRRVQQKFAQARQVYLEIVKKWPETIYAEASRLYAAKCLVAMGKTGEAKPELYAFRASDPYGLYRGEAVLEMGRIALEHHLNPGAAKGCFLLLDTWLKEARNNEPLNIEKLAVREAATKVTTPPRQEKYTDFWGNVKKNAIEPGQLVNRNTCPWYLDDLAEQCAMYLGFLAFVEGKKDQALAWYAKILDCDPATRRLDTSGVWNDYSRLKWGAEHGHLYAFPQELALFKDPRHRLGVLLCDFYYVTERWDKARNLARNLLDGKYGPVSPAAREYVQYIHAAGVFRTEGRDKAIPEYLKVVRAAPRGNFRSFTQQRAAYAAANLGRGSSKKKVRELARELLVRLARSLQQTSETYKARIVLAQDLIREKHVAEGLALLKTFPKDAGDYKALADYYLAKYAKQYQDQGRD